MNFSAHLILNPQGSSSAPELLCARRVVGLGVKRLLACFLSDPTFWQAVMCRMIERQTICPWPYPIITLYCVYRRVSNYKRRFETRIETRIQWSRVWLRSCLFCEGRISVLKRWFKTPIQNRPSREYCSCFPREEDDFVSMHCALFEAIVRAQVNRKGVYMTSFKRGYMWFCVHASPESAFCSNHDRKRTFLGVLNQRFETTFIRK